MPLAADAVPLMLDVHIADSFEAASRVDPAFSIDFDVHRVLFHGGSEVTSACPTLNRIRNYYADCTFTGAEIAVLHEEVLSLLASLAADSPFRSMLVLLGDACQTAIQREHSLFFLCD